MKIAFTSPVAVINSGGVEMLVRELISGLAKSHEILLISPDAPEGLEQFGLSEILFDHLSVESNWGQPWIESLIQWLKEHQVDLCHFHSGGTYDWKSGSLTSGAIRQVARSGIPCLNTNHQAVSPFDVSKTNQPLLRRAASFLKRWPGKARHLSAAKREIMVSRKDLATARNCFPFHILKLDQIYHSRLDSSTQAAPLGVESRVILNLASIAFHAHPHRIIHVSAE